MYMGIIWSFLPSIERNTMCCVDVRSRKAACYVEPKIQYAPYSPMKKHSETKPEELGPANEIEWNAM